MEQDEQQTKKGRRPLTYKTEIVRVRVPAEFRAQLQKQIKVLIQSYHVRCQNPK